MRHSKGAGRKPATASHVGGHPPVVPLPAAMSGSVPGKSTPARVAAPIAVAVV